MGYPKRFVQTIDSVYSMEVDVSKWDCAREAPHWHLCEHGQRVGQIFVGSSAFTKLPSGVNNRIVNKAIELTQTYASDIREAYLYNKDNGAD